MKKYLAMFMTLLMMFSLVSCGDTSQESSSEPSSGVPESVAEEITTEPEVTTVKTTKRRVKNTKPATTETTVSITTQPVSNYETYENDYYTMSISSEWDSLSKDYSKWFKISSNLQLELWNAPTSLRYDNNKDFAEYWVKDANSDSQTTNLSEVSVFGENYFAHSINDNCYSYVCQNGEYLNFFYFYFEDTLKEDEEKIISDILTSVNLKYMNKLDNDKKNNTSEVESKKIAFYELLFELPLDCKIEEKQENAIYNFKDSSFISIVKQSGASEFDLYNSDDDAKKLTLEVILSSMMESSKLEKSGESEVISINGEFALKQEATMYGEFSHVSIYAFVYGDNVYVICFTSMGEDGTQAYDAQDKIIESISFSEDTTTTTTEKPTEPPTEAPTKAPTQPPTEMPVVQKEERTVYYTETGSKYHYDSKCGRGNYFPCTLDEALAMGLEPCKKCT